MGLKLAFLGRPPSPPIFSRRSKARTCAPRGGKLNHATRWTTWLAGGIFCVRRFAEVPDFSIGLFMAVNAVRSGFSVDLSASRSRHCT